MNRRTHMLAGQWLRAPIKTGSVTASPIHAARAQADLLRALKNSVHAVSGPLADLKLPPRAQHLMDPDTIAQLRPAAVLVAIIERDEGLQVLFTLRSDNLRQHPGQISFPGGSSEPQDQDLVATALRESHEEIGLEPDMVEVIGFLDDYPTITGFRITPVVGLLKPEAKYLPDGVEVSEIFEVPLAYIADDESFERKTLVRKGLKVPYYAIAHNDYRIWGATAGMLRDLHNKIIRAL